jgi:hypothetical protein
MDYILFHQMVTDGTYKLSFLKINHYTHSSFEKSVIERVMQYVKDKTERFEDYIPCKRKNEIETYSKSDEFICRFSKHGVGAKWTEPL